MLQMTFLFAKHITENLRVQALTTTVNLTAEKKLLGSNIIQVKEEKENQAGRDTLKAALKLMVVK